MAKIRKPKDIAQDEYKSAKWDELTRGREFSREHVSYLRMLINWHAIADKAMEDMAGAYGVSVTYETEGGDLKERPEIAILKKASTEIRQLNKQLGIKDSVETTPKKEKPKEEASVLSLVTENRRSRATA
jgi:hypothetical protein